MSSKIYNLYLIGILFVCLNGVFFASCSNEVEADRTILGDWVTYYDRGGVWYAYHFEPDGTVYYEKYVRGRADDPIKYNYIHDEEGESLCMWDGSSRSVSECYLAEGKLWTFGAEFSRFYPERSEYSIEPVYYATTETSYGIYDDETFILGNPGENVRITFKTRIPGNKYEILDSYLVISSPIIDSADTINVNNITNWKGEFSYEFSTERFRDKMYQYCSVKLYRTYRFTGPICGEYEGDEREFKKMYFFPAVFFKRD